MRASGGRVLFATVACALWLGGCGTSSQLGGSLQRPDAIQTAPEASEPEPEFEPTGSIASVPADPGPASKDAPGNNPNADASLGKKYFKAAKFALAERHFRRALERHPLDLESWIGLAACYDRLRQFDRADRAYAQAMKIAGPTPELLNNHGYSYILRGDYRRARETLRDAQAQDPRNPYIKNNLELLEASVRKGKAVQ